MPKLTATPNDVVAFLGFKIREHLQEKQLTVRDFADQVGMSHVTILNIKNGKTHSLRLDTLHAVAGALGIDTNGLYAEVAQYRKEHPEEEERRVDYDERYPNRTAAAEFARVAGISEKAIRVVMGYSLKSAVDPDPLSWLDMMRDEDRKQKFLERGGIERTTPITAADLPAPPKLPKKKK